MKNKVRKNQKIFKVQMIVFKLKKRIKIQIIKNWKKTIQYDIIIKYLFAILIFQKFTNLKLLKLIIRK